MKKLEWASKTLYVPGPPMITGTLKSATNWYKPATRRRNSRPNQRLLNSLTSKELAAFGETKVLRNPDGTKIEPLVKRKSNDNQK